MSSTTTVSLAFCRPTSPRLRSLIASYSQCLTVLRITFTASDVLPVLVLRELLTHISLLIKAVSYRRPVVRVLLIVLTPLVSTRSQRSAVILSRS